MSNTKKPAFTGRGTAIEALRMMQETDCWGFTDLPMKLRQKCRCHLDGAIHAVLNEWYKHQEACETAWDQYLDLRKQVHRSTDDEAKGLLIRQAMELATRWGFDPNKVSPWRNAAIDPPPDGVLVLCHWDVYGSHVARIETGRWWTDGGKWAERAPDKWMPIPEVSS